MISSAWAQAKISFEIYGFAQAGANIDTNTERRFQLSVKYSFSRQLEL